MEGLSVTQDGLEKVLYKVDAEHGVLWWDRMFCG